MIYSDKIHDVLARPDERGRFFTGLEIAAIAGAVSSVAGIGMSIIGSAQKSEAQQQAARDCLLAGPDPEPASAG